MRTSLNITNKINVLSQMQSDSIFQILEYDSLKGGDDIDSAMKLKFMHDSGIKLKQLRIVLDESAVRIEAGLLSYLKGDINIKNKATGPLGFSKKIFTSALTGERIFNPEYSGTGEIFLEPSFAHFALVELQDEEIIVDKSMFCACESGIEVSASIQKNISSMFLGNEGLFQTKISGSGIVVLNLNVPESEIFKCVLFDETLKVDGDFAVLRTGDIEFSVQKSTKSLIGSKASGEGFLNVYSGTGEVWLAPTQGIYNSLKIEGLKENTKVSEKSNTNEEK